MEYLMSKDVNNLMKLYDSPKDLISAKETIKK